MNENANRIKAAIEPTWELTIDRVARAIHDATWDDRYDDLSVDGIERAMARLQAVAAVNELKRMVDEGVHLTKE